MFFLTLTFDVWLLSQEWDYWDYSSQHLCYENIFKGGKYVSYCFSPGPFIFVWYVSEICSRAAKWDLLFAADCRVVNTGRQQARLVTLQYSASCTGAKIWTTANFPVQGLFSGRKQRFKLENLIMKNERIQFCVSFPGFYCFVSNILLGARRGTLDKYNSPCAWQPDPQP